jgi:hypothetical protein
MQISLDELTGYYAAKRDSMEPAAFKELMANSLNKAKALFIPRVLRLWPPTATLW